jgi:SagB-type dehydrogenase family enzyme
MEIAARPYPSGGASYELELYLAVDRCDGLSRGFYHYDADRHVLVAIEATDRQLEAILHDGQFAMGAPDRPQILIVMAARFGRVSWKYSGFAYSFHVEGAVGQMAIGRGAKEPGDAPR